MVRFNAIMQGAILIPSASVPSTSNVLAAASPLRRSGTILSFSASKSPQIPSRAVLPIRGCRDGPAQFEFIALDRGVTAVVVAI